MQNGKKYWIVEKLGKSGNRLESECPEGERWVCFTFAVRGRVQDLVKKKISKQKSNTSSAI